MRGSKRNARAITDIIWFYIKYPIPATILTLIFIIAYFVLRYQDLIFLAIPAVIRVIIFLLIFVLGPIVLIYVFYHYILKKSSDDYYEESDDEMSDYKICRKCGEYFLPQKSYYHTCPDCFQKLK